MNCFPRFLSCFDWRSKPLFIVPCLYWSKNKYIHLNVLMTLYLVWHTLIEQDTLLRQTRIWALRFNFFFHFELVSILGLENYVWGHINMHILHFQMKYLLPSWLWQLNFWQRFQDRTKIYDTNKRYMAYLMNLFAICMYTNVFL